MHSYSKPGSQVASHAFRALVEREAREESLERRSAAAECRLSETAREAVRAQRRALSIR
ncbi:MAG: hypothetical protein NVSMB31_09870 [Vulcanimicrobiaceae bacterium]